MYPEVVGFESQLVPEIFLWIQLFSIISSYGNMSRSFLSLLFLAIFNLMVPPLSTMHMTFLILTHTILVILSVETSPAASPSLVKRARVFATPYTQLTGRAERGREGREGLAGRLDPTHNFVSGPWHYEMGRGGYPW